MAWALASIFLLAFMIEMWVTTHFFMHGSKLKKHLSLGMRRWAFISLALMSSVNLAGLQGVIDALHDEVPLELHNYVQAMFAISTLSLLSWVYTFHKMLWKGGADD
jgi:hypothetical protein